MLVRFRPRFIDSNVMATVAVFVVLGGGSYAVATRTIRSRELRGQRRQERRPQEQQHARHGRAEWPPRPSPESAQPGNG
jgi:hypothetical protein